MSGDLKIYTANRAKSGNTVWVNGERLDEAVSQAVYNHSPTGFEWGYGGSGPSQLALAILVDVLGNSQEALRYYQRFKSEFIVTAPFEGFVITSLEVSAWYTKQRSQRLDD